MVRDRLVVLAFRLAWAGVPALPEALAARGFDLMADIAWLRGGRGARRLERNLAQVTGLRGQPLRDLSRRALRSYARYWRELFQLSAWTPDEIEARLELRGREHVDEALAAGRGVVLAATHSGNWDLPGAWCGRHYGRATTVAERLRPVELFDTFVAARERHGIEVLPHTGGARQPLAVLLERLRAGGLVGLVADRDLSSRGVEVQFFGATARMAAGPAVMARSTGAALIPIGVWNQGSKVVVQFHSPIPTPPESEVQVVAQQLANTFARDIAAHPEDWHMLQRVWLEPSS